jgi:SNF2 family DNA or RNA helicase
MMLDAAFYGKLPILFSDIIQRAASSGILNASIVGYYLPDLPPDQVGLVHHDIAMNDAIISARIYSCVFGFEALPPILSKWVYGLDKNTFVDKIEVRKALAYYHYFRAEWEKLRDLIPLLNEADQLLWAGTLLIDAGKYEDALVALETSEKIAKKAIDKKYVPKGLNAWLYRLLLIKLKPEKYEKKLASLSKAIMQDDEYLLGGNQSISALVSHFDLDQEGAMKTIGSMTSSVSMSKYIKIQTLAIVAPDKLKISEVESLFLDAQKGGYQQIADELKQIVQIRLKTSKLSQEITQPILEPRAQYWANLFQGQSRWQMALDMLNTLSDSTTETTNKTTNRIIWLVDFESRHFEIKQQANTKGTWGAGKKVTPKRLKAEDLPGMTEQDRKLTEWYELDYYENTSIKPRFWRELCGHPLLYLLKSPEISVQLIAETPVLQAQQTKQGFTLQLVPALPARSVLPIIKETPTRYKYIDATEKHYLIQNKILLDQLIIPSEGEAMLQKSLEQLSALMPVQSSLLQVSENLPEIPTDSRVCLHVLPVGDKFHVEMYVRPFGKVPPYLTPGKGDKQIISVVDGSRALVNRKLKAETDQVKLIKSKIAVLQAKPDELDTWHLDDTESCLDFLSDIKPLIDAETMVLEWPQGERMRVQRVVGFDQFRVQVGSGANWFEVNATLQIDENKVLNLQQLLKLTEQKSQFIELGPGNFLAITNELRRRLKAINALMQPGKNGAMNLHPLATSALSPLLELTGDVTLDKKFKDSEKRAKAAFSETYRVPKNFNASLRPYQLEGFVWLHRCAAWGVGAVLADDMGLGKTIQALAFLTDRAKQGPALVVAPASVARNWHAETLKFAPALQSLLYGEGDRTEMIQSAGNGDLVITTYDLLVRSAELFQNKKFSTIILDEAQAIKNRATKRSETVMQLQGDFKLVMSGTPVENHLGELWNLFQFVNPGLLGSIDSFNERFAMPIEKYKDDNRRDQLKRLIQPFILRRRKADVLKELPAKTEIMLTVQLSEDERAFYEVIRRNAIDAITNANDAKGGEKHLQILAEIMRLRRAACHPLLVDDSSGFSNSSKLQLFGEVVDELIENGHRALVFSQFVGHLNLLRKHLDSKKIKYQYLDGQTPLKKRQEQIVQYQEGADPLFLISLKAGGTGLNLTAADYVIHMDPWWNPAVEDQATDRAHRFGQLKPVTVYRLVAENTIEEKILKLHESKRDLADSILSGGDMSAKLNYDDLVNLLKEG